jgi:superfamily II DNA or RNA helicase
LQVKVDGRVWLDKEVLSQQQLRNIRHRLTIQPTVNTEFSSEPVMPILLFKETDRWIGLPRGFYLKSRQAVHSETIMATDGGAMSGFSSKMKFEGPYAEQGAAIEQMLDYTRENEWGGFILRAGCGFGKTNVALEFARRLGKRTLILVHKEFFLRQWRDRIIEFMPDAKIGLIQQDQCDFAGCDFVIGMLQSIARDNEDGKKYPDEMYDAFGLIVSDECHRVGAQSWADIIPRFKAKYRLGLTATPRRKDGAEDVFYNHIGEILYSAKTNALVPSLRRVKTPFLLKPVRMRGKIVAEDKLNHTQVVSQLIDDPVRNRIIADEVAQAVAKGRKVMVVSERLGHLKTLEREIAGVLLRMPLDFEPVIDCYTGEWYAGGTDAKGDPRKRTRTEEDLKQAERANVVLATKQMIEEGLDIPAIDVLLFATPLGDAEQAVGRVRRHCKPSESKCKHLCPWRAGSCEGKPHPIVVDIIDENVTRLVNSYRRRLSFYKEIGTVA